MNKKIIILAGSRQEYEKWLDDNGMTDSEAIYGYSQERMAGVEASSVKIIGTFYDRHDNYELRQYADSRIR